LGDAGVRVVVAVHRLEVDQRDLGEVRLRDDALQRLPAEAARLGQAAALGVLLGHLADEGVEHLVRVQAALLGHRAGGVHRLGPGPPGQREGDGAVGAVPAALEGLGADGEAAEARGRPRVAGG
ncbi:MAG: hypothetical protein ACK559_09070, partial [bacterium]